MFQAGPNDQQQGDKTKFSYDSFKRVTPEFDSAYKTGQHLQQFPPFHITDLATCNIQAKSKVVEAAIRKILKLEQTDKVSISAYKQVLKDCHRSAKNGNYKTPGWTAVDQTTRTEIRLHFMKLTRTNPEIFGRDHHPPKGGSKSGTLAESTATSQWIVAHMFRRQPMALPQDRGSGGDPQTPKGGTQDNQGGTSPSEPSLTSKFPTNQ